MNKYEKEENYIKPNKVDNSFQIYCQKVLPLELDESMSYYETLLALTKIVKECINTVNSNSDTVIQLQNLFKKLESYVLNYFDNLDVQDEINNKLDKMAESGELEIIIETYLSLNSLINFNTVNDLRNATNLKPNCTIKTLGFYSFNDGGNATYKIREKKENEEETPSRIFLSNNLVAELIMDNYINILQLGAKNEENFDNTIFIQNAIDNYKKIFIPQGTFYTSNIVINNQIELFGIYNKSWLKALTTSTDKFLTVNAPYTKINNICLDGNKINNSNTLIGIFTQQGNTDYHFLLQNLVVTNFNGNGLNISRGANLIDNCYFHHNEGYGIYHNGSDNVFTNCQCAWNYLGGVRDQGASTKWCNCKCYVNGESYNINLKPHNTEAHGFRFSDSKNNLIINCDSQENYANGFYITAYKNADFINCIADNNGMYNYKYFGSDESKFTKYYGFYIHNCHNLNVIGNTDNFRSPENSWNCRTQYASLKLRKDCTNNNITLTSMNQIEDIFNDWEEFKNMQLNNQVICNNINWQKKIYGGIIIHKDLWNTCRLDFGEDNEEDIKYRLGTETDGSLRLYMYQNGTMLQNGNPLQINKDIGMIVGKNKLGFFGKTPVAKETAKANATDLNSAIALVNDLKFILKNLGLIG